MFTPQPWRWPNTWRLYAGWDDLFFAIAALVVITFLSIWWRQQTRRWFRVVAGTFLIALVLSIASIYLFQVPAYYAGCIQGCPGWSGYPLRVARLGLDGALEVAPLDFVVNLLMLWLLWLGASLIWTLLAMGFQWWRRSRRTRMLFVLAAAILPLALLPRVLNPPQPPTGGEDLRLANNARRAAEFTYRITGIWVQRLAFEDIRYGLDDPGSGNTLGQRPGTEVCLRGYTYFYIPWRRYRISLEESGVTALSLTELPLTGSCWQ